MSIRNRVEGMGPTNFIASQTNLVIGAFRMPAKGRIRAVRIHSLTVAGGTPTVSVMRSATMTPDDSAANSTTLVHDAAISVTTSDAPYADPMTGQYIIEKGVWLFAKYTSAAGVSTTTTTVLIEIDY